MASYTPGGKGHLMLALLEEGPAFHADLVRTLNLRPRRLAKSVGWQVITALLDDNLMARTSEGAFKATPAGRAKLAELRAEVVQTREAA